MSINGGEQRSSTAETGGGAPAEHSLFGAVAGDYRASWKTLVLTDLVYKIIAVIALVPLVGVLFRVWLAISGKTILADLDILFFLLSPLGWLCSITVGGLWLGIVALGLAALMGVLCAREGQRQMHVVDALRFAWSNIWPILRVTGRMVAFTLLAVAPFLAAAGVTYWALLPADINFYLKEKPPNFLIALGIGGVLLLGLGVVLLRLFTGWFFALQLVLFENVAPTHALRASRDRATGRRRGLLLWIVGWALVSLALSAMVTAIVVGVGHLVVPVAVGSLRLLAVAIGLMLLLWFILSLAVALFTSTIFATILFRLYRRLACRIELDPSKLPIGEVASSDRPRFRLTRMRLLVGCIVGVVLAMTIGAVSLYSVRMDDNVQVIAHRGSSKDRPENTMAAFTRAIEDGADWIELDVQETADGEVVVFHDSDFMKLADDERKIWNVTEEDLKNIDVGSWFSPDYKDQRVPTLSQVLDECKGKVGVNIELKYYGHDKQLEQRVVDIVEAHDMASEIVVMSLKPDAVRKMKELRPKWKVGLLKSVSAGDEEGIDFLAVNAGFVTAGSIRAAHDKGREVFVWTVNDAPTMSIMIGRGVDGLITDKPALARSVIQQRAQMGPAERLLLELADLLGVEPNIAQQ